MIPCLLILMYYDHNEAIINIVVVGVVIIIEIHYYRWNISQSETKTTYNTDADVTTVLDVCFEACVLWGLSVFHSIADPRSENHKFIKIFVLHNIVIVGSILFSL